MAYSVNEEKNSLELKVPDYYLKMDLDTIKQYCKLAKVSQEDKHKKAVAAFIESGTKKQRKTSMSVNAKEFFPKSQLKAFKPKSGSFDATRRADDESSLSDSSSTSSHIKNNNLT